MVLSNSVGSTELSFVEFWSIILIKGCVVFTWEVSKHGLEVIQQTLDIGLSSVALRAVFVLEEVSPEMVTRSSNSLEGVVPRISPKLVIELFRFLHGSNQVVDIYNDILIVISSITHPNIRVSEAGEESQVT